MTTETRWSKEDVQRVLYNVVKKYEAATSPKYRELTKDGYMDRVTRRRWFVFGERPPALGGDSELLRDAIRIARLTLKDNGWWPEDDHD